MPLGATTATLFRAAVFLCWGVPIVTELGELLVDSVPLLKQEGDCLLAKFFGLL
jgi:hypothetical protein